MNAISAIAGSAPAPDFDQTFSAHYDRIARVIRRVIHDPARAEDLAVEVFLKLWRNPAAQGDQTQAWLYRAAVRKALDELRRRTRRSRYEALCGFGRGNATPEDVRAASEAQDQVRRVLAALQPRQAELLLLRSDELSYAEIAAALELNPASVGTLLARAQTAFRKEYEKHYGTR